MGKDSYLMRLKCTEKEFRNNISISRYLDDSNDDEVYLRKQFWLDSYVFKYFSNKRAKEYSEDSKLYVLEDSDLTKIIELCEGILNQGIDYFSKEIEDNDNKYYFMHYIEKVEIEDKDIENIKEGVSDILKGIRHVFEGIDTSKETIIYLETEG